MQVSIHGDSPSSHPFLDGISPTKTINLLGYPHVWQPPYNDIDVDIINIIELLL